MDVSYDSTLLQLEALENEYYLVMLEYQQMFQTYLDVSNSNSTSNINLILSDTIMTNATAATVSSMDSIDLCQAACSSNPNCAGATYLPSDNLCEILTGDNLTPVGPINGYYAIVTELSQLANALKEINGRLTTIFTNINTTINKMQPGNAQEQMVKNEAAEKLNVKYQHLLYDRSQLDTLEQQNMQLTKEYDMTGITVRQTNYAYILWFLFALFIFIGAIKLSFMLNT